MRIDHVLRPVMAIGLIVSRETIRAVTENSSHVLAAVSAMRATVGGAGLAVLAVLTTALIRHIGPVMFGVVAVLPGIIPAVVPEVLVTEAVVSFEVVLRVFGNSTVGELPVAGSFSNERPLLRLSIPTDVASGRGRQRRRG